MRKNAMADPANPTRNITLRVAMGPKRSVIGAPRTPSNGMVVLSMRFTPTGAFSHPLTKGLAP